MSNIIQIKRGAGKPANGSLVPYELGYDTTNGYLYIGTGTLESPTVGGIKVEYAASANSATSLTSTLPINKGGTGATTAAAALTNLGIKATATELNYVTGVTSGIQSQLNGKSNSGHTHDDRYYTESEVNTKLNGKSNSDHTHDDRYYTESEVNTKLNTKANLSSDNTLSGHQTLNNTKYLKAKKSDGTVVQLLGISSGNNIVFGDSTKTDLNINIYGKINLKNATILSSAQYGSELPSTGVAGQIFFLLDE